MAKKTYEIDDYTSDTIAYGSVHIFMGLPPSQHDQLYADMKEAAGHGQFVNVHLNAKGEARIIGDAALQEALVATLADAIVAKLADRAEALFVERVQPVLAAVQSATG